MNYIQFGGNTRIGNWLFQVAFARLLGPAPVAYYVEPKYSTSKLEAFREMFPDVTVVRDLPPDVREYSEAELVANGFRLPAQRDNLLIRGYFQIPVIFDRSVLVCDFACPMRVCRIIEAKFGELLKRPLLVGVSVRRGDYLTLPHQHPFVGKAYLREAVGLFDASATYVVCSDDIPWCKAFFSERRFPGRKFVFIEGEEVLTQLYIHTRCHHNILSNSTFSWWGAYLNVHAGRRVVFPSMWNGIWNGIHSTHLYLEEAEVIANHYSPCMYLKALALCGKLLAGRALRSVGVLKKEVRS